MSAVRSAKLALSPAPANPERFFDVCPSPEDIVPRKVSVDREALRALVANADLLGADGEGSPWLLIRTTPELLEFLATIDAENEDTEADDHGEDNGDDELGDEDTDEGEEWALNPRLRKVAVRDLSQDCDAEPSEDYEHSAQGTTV